MVGTSTLTLIGQDGGHFGPRGTLSLVFLIFPFCRHTVVSAEHPERLVSKAFQLISISIRRAMLLYLIGVAGQ